ncbi:hypothetical protein CDL15_Pgr017611 [Punica granatum]|uniref:Uncharacterized protein n=1 Tax=Punica granatum TaxID=22663 RepID=A0A218W675_PUNGR|nr:hypothetical protein CDL15_Pgr017611 [Punica granatum]
MNRTRSDRTEPPEGKPPGSALGRTARKNAGPDWGSWAWLGLDRACEKKKKTGPWPVSRRAAGIGGQRRRRAWGRRFSPLDAATTAGMDAGDSSGRCRCFAVVDRDLTGA